MSQPLPKRQPKVKREAINTTLPSVSSYPPPNPAVVAAVREHALDICVSDAEVADMINAMFGI